MAVSSPTAPASVGARISDQEFDAIRRLVYSNFGINLTEQKKTLVVGRLQKVLRDRGFATFQDYFTWLTNDKSGDGLDELANRISTNHTFFYREKAHFEYFAKTVLPEAVDWRRKQGRKDLRIWCAGCSSGEEPYTLMMLIMDHLGAELKNWTPILLATDISATALKKAMSGVYEAERVAELPADLRNRYFDRTATGELSVSGPVRERIHYRRHNLMDATFPFKHQFDAIFCRNVMIYFDRETRQTLVAKYHQHTRPGGYLFIGHSESLNRSETEYRYVMPAVYRK